MSAYKQAGVDINRADRILELMGKEFKKTHSSDVISSDSGFASLFRVPKGYENPVIVSSTDGVGTKLCLATQYDHLEDIGQDLVAMCVNDLITTGADPLFFLDYYATGKLSAYQCMNVLASIVRACGDCGMSLVGGETAEMPTLYSPGDIDLAGFAVGMVNEDDILTPRNVKEGDAIIGVQSSGFHANGYSLINKLLVANGIMLPIDMPDDLLEALLTPTRLYVDMMKSVRHLVKSAANITGGGIVANATRAIPDECRLQIVMDSWDYPLPFTMFADYHDLSFEDQVSTFNCGIGFVLIVEPDKVADVHKLISYPSWTIGKVI